MEKQKNLYYIYKKNELFAQKAELKLKLINANITIPALFIEHKINNNLTFNLDDLKQFYMKFGEVLNIIIKDNKNIVLFKNFLNANICKIFLEQKENHKIYLGDNFTVRWFDLNNDHYLLNKEIKELYLNISHKNISQIKYGNNNAYMNNNNIYNFNINKITNNTNINNNIPDFHIINNLQNKNSFNNINNMIMNSNNNINSLNANNVFNNINIGMMNNINNINNYNNINIINNMNNINNIEQNSIYNRNVYIHNNNNNLSNKNNIKNININEDSKIVKYTCKYEILIENDSEFQIARKLIGSKGINMKRIINKCKIDKDKETIKLRLRGKGSGYKEGPNNKESDDPLHLCISTKTKEEMNKVCFLVDKLLEKIGDEYKIFCEKKGIDKKIDNIAIKIENKNINYKFN